jgi:hypothetical protein
VLKADRVVKLADLATLRASSGDIVPITKSVDRIPGEAVRENRRFVTLLAMNALVLLVAAMIWGHRLWRARKQAKRKLD